MRKRNLSSVFLCILLLLLCLGGTALYAWTFILVDDTTPPVISMASDYLEVSVSASDAELLADVTALDDRDGDVTADMLVQGVSNLVDDTVVVTYAAFDSAGNVSKASRTLRYTDYEQPRFQLNSGLIFSAGSSMELLEKFTVTDVVDGDISNRIKAGLVGDTSSLNQVGIHQVEFRVTNSLGETVYLTLPVDVLNAGQYNAEVVLDTYLVYIPQGSRFEPREYLKGLDTRMSDKLQSDLSGLDVKIESNVDTDVPGTYSVRYTVSDTQGVVDYVGYTRLNVIVEER